MLLLQTALQSGAVFFFVGKENGSLRPYIGYRRLNDITIKNSYPFPLISSKIDLLQGAQMST